MQDIRRYRIFWLAALVAVVAAMFSLHSLPAGVEPPLEPDALEREEVQRSLSALMKRYPDRAAGSKGDAAAASWVASRLSGLGYAVSREQLEGPVEGTPRRMVNVLGELTGSSARRIVVVAHRDSPRPGDAWAAAPTASLVELAATLRTVARKRTLLLVSTDGATAGAAGARRLAQGLRKSGPVDAVIVMGASAKDGPTGPQVIPWGAGAERAPLPLVATGSRAIERQAGRPPEQAGTIGQVARLAFPLTLAEQGPLVSSGFASATLDLGREAAVRGKSDMDRAGVRATRMGRAALATVMAVDRAPDRSTGPTGTFVTLGAKYVPAWAFRLLVLALILPVAAVACGSFFSASRRGERPLVWALWTCTPAMAIVVALLYAYGFEWVGFLPKVPSYPLDPRAVAVSAQTMVAVGVLAGLAAGSWLVVSRLVGYRDVLRGRASTFGPPAAVITVALTVALAVWAFNPFAALFVVPALHLWTWSLIADPPLPNRASVAMLVAGVLVPAFAVLYYALALGVGIKMPYYTLMLFAGGYVSMWSGIGAALFVACFVGGMVIVLMRGREQGAAGEDRRDALGIPYYVEPGAQEDAAPAGTGSHRRFRSVV